ncbi:MAG: hypothetical protein EKK34_31680, partial [Mycobacterium sp.]
MLDLRSLHETIFGFENPKDAFRRTMLRVSEATGERGVVDGQRTAQWFRRNESPWFCRRLGLLDSDQWLVGPLCIVERGFEL